MMPLPLPDPAGRRFLHLTRKHEIQQIGETG